ncbi:spatacsin [Anaeramoeba ignava]|uniref:Spatacsin n=1 Tax=Anaeramoeba ignava TaxID=1746090 RepID=A0A9Q0LUU3_ANAIG|nr:spatacsin [Anaeramoeba ignava]
MSQIFETFKLSRFKSNKFLLENYQDCKFYFPFLLLVTRKNELILKILTKKHFEKKHFEKKNFEKKNFEKKHFEKKNFELQTIENFTLQNISNFFIAKNSNGSFLLTVIDSQNNVYIVKIILNSNNSVSSENISVVESKQTTNSNGLLLDFNLQLSQLQNSKHSIIIIKQIFSKNQILKCIQNEETKQFIQTISSIELLEIKNSQKYQFKMLWILNNNVAAILKFSQNQLFFKHLFTLQPQIQNSSNQSFYDDRQAFIYLNNSDFFLVSFDSYFHQYPNHSTLFNEQCFHFLKSFRNGFDQEQHLFPKHTPFEKYHSVNRTKIPSAMQAYLPRNILRKNWYFGKAIISTKHIGFSFKMNPLNFDFMTRWDTKSPYLFSPPWTSKFSKYLVSTKTSFNTKSLDSSLKNTHMSISQNQIILFSHQNISNDSTLKLQSISNFGNDFLLVFQQNNLIQLSFLSIDKKQAKLIINSYPFQEPCFIIHKGNGIIYTLTQNHINISLLAISFSQIIEHLLSVNTLDNFQEIIQINRWDIHKIWKQIFEFSLKNQRTDILKNLILESKIDEKFTSYLVAFSKTVEDLIIIKHHQSDFRSFLSSLLPILTQLINQYSQHFFSSISLESQNLIAKVEWKSTKYTLSANLPNQITSHFAENFVSLSQIFAELISKIITVFNPITHKNEDQKDPISHSNKLMDEMFQFCIEGDISKSLQILHQIIIFPNQKIFSKKQWKLITSFHSDLDLLDVFKHVSLGISHWLFSQNHIEFALKILNVSFLDPHSLLHQLYTLTLDKTIRNILKQLIQSSQEISFSENLLSLLDNQSNISNDYKLVLNSRKRKYPSETQLNINQYQQTKNLSSKIKENSRNNKLLENWNNFSNQIQAQKIYNEIYSCRNIDDEKFKIPLESHDFSSLPISNTNQNNLPQNQLLEINSPLYFVSRYSWFQQWSQSTQQRISLEFDHISNNTSIFHNFIQQNSHLETLLSDKIRYFISRFDFISLSHLIKIHQKEIVSDKKTALKLFSNSLSYCSNFLRTKIENYLIQNSILSFKNFSNSKDFLFHLFYSSHFFHQEIYEIVNNKNNLLQNIQIKSNIHSVNQILEQFIIFCAENSLFNVLNLIIYHFNFPLENLLQKEKPSQILSWLKIFEIIQNESNILHSNNEKIYDLSLLNFQAISNIEISSDYPLIWISSMIYSDRFPSLFQINEKNQSNEIHSFFNKYSKLYSFTFPQKFLNQFEKFSKENENWNNQLNYFSSRFDCSIFQLICEERKMKNIKSYILQTITKPLSNLFYVANPNYQESFDIVFHLIFQGSFSGFYFWNKTLHNKIKIDLQQNDYLNTLHDLVMIIAIENFLNNSHVASSFVFLELMGISTQKMVLFCFISKILHFYYQINQHQSPFFYQQNEDEKELQSLWDFKIINFQKMFKNITFSPNINQKVKNQLFSLIIPNKSENVEAIYQQLLEVFNFFRKRVRQRYSVNNFIITFWIFKSIQLFSTFYSIDFSNSLISIFLEDGDWIHLLDLFSNCELKSEQIILMNQEEFNYNELYHIPLIFRNLLSSKPLLSSKLSLSKQKIIDFNILEYVIMIQHQYLHVSNLIEKGIVSKQPIYITTADNISNNIGLIPLMIAYFCAQNIACKDIVQILFQFPEFQSENQEEILNQEELSQKKLIELITQNSIKMNHFNKIILHLVEKKENYLVMKAFEIFDNGNLIQYFLKFIRFFQMNAFTKCKLILESFPENFSLETKQRIGDHNWVFFVSKELFKMKFDNQFNSFQQKIFIRILSKWKLLALVFPSLYKMVKFCTKIQNSNIIINIFHDHESNIQKLTQNSMTKEARIYSNEFGLSCDLIALFHVGKYLAPKIKLGFKIHNSRKLLIEKCNKIFKKWRIEQKEIVAEFFLLQIDLMGSFQEIITPQEYIFILEISLEWLESHSKRNLFEDYINTLKLMIKFFSVIIELGKWNKIGSFVRFLPNPNSHISFNENQFKNEFENDEYLGFTLQKLLEFQSNIDFWNNYLLSKFEKRMNSYKNRILQKITFTQQEIEVFDLIIAEMLRKRMVNEAIKLYEEFGFQTKLDLHIFESSCILAESQKLDHPEKLIPQELKRKFGKEKQIASKLDVILFLMKNSRKYKHHVNRVYIDLKISSEINISYQEIQKEPFKIVEILLNQELCGSSIFFKFVKEHQLLSPFLDGLLVEKCFNCILQHENDQIEDETNFGYFGDHKHLETQSIDDFFYQNKNFYHLLSLIDQQEFFARRLLLLFEKKTQNSAIKIKTKSKIFVRAFLCFEHTSSYKYKNMTEKSILKLILECQEQKNTELLSHLFVQIHNNQHLKLIFNYLQKQENGINLLFKRNPNLNNITNLRTVLLEFYSQKLMKNRALLSKVFEHFGLWTDLGNVLLENSHKKIQKITSKNYIPLKIHNFKKFHSIQKNLVKSSQCFSEAKLDQKLLKSISLFSEISIQIECSDIQLFGNVSKQEILKQKLTNFYHALTFAEIHNLDHEEIWAQCLFHQIIYQQNMNYTFLFITVFIIKKTLIKKLSQIYKLEISRIQNQSRKEEIKQNMASFLLEILPSSDYLCIFKVAKKLGFEKEAQFIDEKILSKQY